MGRAIGAAGGADACAVATPPRAVIPTVFDQTARGERAVDIYSLLLKDRIVFLGQEVDDQIANLLVAEILYLAAEDAERDIALSINSPGGLSYAGMAIYDAMQHVACDVSTICVGMGMSAAAMILCGGATGKRYAPPNSRIMIHQGTAGTRGAPRDMEGRAQGITAISSLTSHCGWQPSEGSCGGFQAEVDGR